MLLSGSRALQLRPAACRWLTSRKAKASSRTEAVRVVSASQAPFTPAMSSQTQKKAPKDYSSVSNVNDARVEHAHFDLTVDFSAKRIRGFAKLRVAFLNPAEEAVILDTRDLTVTEASASAPGGAAAPAAFSFLEHRGPLGTPLRVVVPQAARGAGGVAEVTVKFETSPTSSACQFLDPAQTAGGKHPYLFTQCQAIHARSLVPCQDTPAAKLSYTAAVTVPEALTALMSAVPAAACPAGAPAPAPPPAGLRTFFFEQRVPIPSYLIALAAGELDSRDIGPRSRVWSEPSMVDAGAFEFAETEAFLAAGEAIAGPYVWGRYDLLLLPPSFPYGGMENPCLTFVTPTLLAGDRSLANVVAHEIAHSWTGNLVTNASWEHFWLNEGFTVFLERKILGRLKGASTYAFHASGGWLDLVDVVTDLGADHKYTKLVHDLSDGADPDDAFSKIPYEKGFAFLAFLERAAGGAEAFEPFFKDYIQQHSGTTVTTEDFRSGYCARFPGAEVDWDSWLNKPGMPPVDMSTWYDLSARQSADDLARKWHLCNVLGSAAPDRPEGAAADDMKGWSSEQVVAFLDRLAELRAMTPLSPEVCRAMDSLYGLSAWKNAEVRCGWYKLRCAAGDETVLPLVGQFLKEQGRMKYLRPLYRALHRCKGSARCRAFALETFKQAKGGYHPIAAKMVGQDLGVVGAAAAP